MKEIGKVFRIQGRVKSLIGMLEKNGFEIWEPGVRYEGMICRKNSRSIGQIVGQANYEERYISTFDGELTKVLQGYKPR